MVWCGERKGRVETNACSLLEHSGDAVDLGALDRFFERHRRDDGGDAFRQHRFPGTGRSDHEQVMAARDRHFDRALHMPLPFHVTEIDFVILMRFEEGAQIAAGRLHRRSRRG